MLKYILSKSLIILMSMIMVITSTVIAQPPDEKSVIRVGIVSVPSLVTVPIQMTLDQLEEKGYDVEIIEFADITLVIEALANNQIDIAQSSFRSAWEAISNDVKIISILESLNAGDSLVVHKDIESCEDLNGKTIALQSPYGQSSLLTESYLTTVCDSPDLERIYMNSGPNRIAALLSNTIDATTTYAEYTLTLETDAPGEYHVLSNFSKDFPWLLGLGFHTSLDYAENNSVALQDFVTTYIDVVRDVVEDPNLLTDLGIEIFEGDVEYVNAIIDLYVNTNRFDTDGGLNEDDVIQYLDFAVTSGSLPEGLELENLIDLSYIEVALAALDTETE